MAFDELKRTTLRDVARVVGVSEAAASAVLNGTRSGTRVSEQTRVALMAAAKELGYRPNEVARSLVRRRTRLIGLFAHFEYLSARNGFLSELIGGIQEATSENEHDMVLHTVPLESTTEHVLTALSSRRVDGLIYYSPDDNALIPDLANIGLPVVTVVDRSDRVPSVVADDVTGGQMIATRLAERGHRRVLYRDWYRQPVSAVERRRAFTQRAQELGIEVVDGKLMDRRQDASLTEAELGQLQRVRKPATAIVCWEDIAASNTCDALVKMGFRVPQDVAVTGFNGISLDVSLRWSLTTVAAPWRQVGARAVERILGLLDKQDVPPVDVLPVRLVQGETT
jgi:DNA-binding LacI/PurR family transcriptional regulator